MEDQPLHTDASPTALLPGYIDDSNPEEDKEDPEEDPVDYPANGGDNDDNESSDDDDDDDDVEKAQRVANAIEAIAIYETKTNMALKSMSQTKRQEEKISTLVVRQAENKRKLDNTSKNNQNQQQLNKRQTTGRAYTAGMGRETLRQI
nr:hypothetical protein [Tanacetum cinerariifolium]